MIVLTGDNGSNRIFGNHAAEEIYGYDTRPGDAPSVTANRIASGLNTPLYLTAAANDPDHVFVAEKGGVVRIVNSKTGHTLGTPLLDLSSQVATSGEQGLLGLAFDPNHAATGRFYVYVSTKSGDVEIREYKTSLSNPLVADPASMRVIATIDYPSNSTIHRGGWIGFGPDGYLYAATGDGGAGTNPQSVAHLRGKILRLDVNADSFPSDPAQNYGAPADNPASIAGIEGSIAGTGIYAAGLRNPWRASFDRATGEFFIGDVGQSSFEEINLGQAGANYGWRQTEGYFDPSAYPDFTNPIYAYGRDAGRAVTGGYVYRGPEQAFQGKYFFSDFMTKKIWTLQSDGGTWHFTDLTGDVTVNGGPIGPVPSMGEDALGNLYLVDYGGKIFRLDLKSGASPNPADDQADSLHGGGGNDTIHAGGGNDQVFGGTGDDVLHGMDGNDLLVGGAGTDRMIGGDGNDRYVIDDEGDVIVEAADNGNDTIWARIGVSIADDQSIEEMRTENAAGTLPIALTGNALDNQIFGNAGKNVLSGRGGHDLIRGGGGEDQLFGGDGGDRLDGGDGNDLIEGGQGDDRVKGDAGTDTLTGGAGADNFKWRSAADTAISPESADLVLDFNGAAGDRIDLSEMDANGLLAGNQIFAFAGTGPFTAAGQVRYVVQGSETRILVNMDADFGAEAAIRLSGVHALQASHFVL